VESANVTSRAYTIRFVNENTEGWIRTRVDGTVFLGSDNILQHVMNLSISDAMKILESRGWEVEYWEA
jgi:hypothetical protein